MKPTLDTILAGFGLQLDDLLRILNEEGYRLRPHPSLCHAEALALSRARDALHDVLAESPLRDARLVRAHELVSLILDGPKTQER